MTMRVGIIGAGNIFERGYLPALLATELVTVAAVCDLDPDRAARAAERLPGAAALTDDDALVGRDDIEAVLVLTPTSSHAELTIAAIEAGHHVLCEKPMARTSADARRMAEAAARRERRLMIGHTRRFDERWTTIAEQIESGRIGRPVYAYRSEHAWNGAPAGHWMWRDDLSGGALWDVGVHAAELFHWYLGSVPRSAFAKVTHGREESRAGGAPDAAVVTFDFDDARHAVLSASWAHPASWGPFYATTDVVGTEGRIEAYDRDSHPTVVARETLEVPRVSSLLSASATAFRREVEHFASSIASGAPFHVTAEDAVVAVDMIEAAERSVASGQPEPVAGGPA